MEVESEQVSRAGEHSDTDDEDDDDGVVLLHHKLLQSLQSTEVTPLSEQTSMITQLRADPQLMRAVVSHRRHQGQTRIRDESTQTADNLEGIIDGMTSSSNSSFKQKVIEAAFSNVIILDKIFHFHNSPKILRLVCKSWNNVLLSGKSRLSLNLASLPYENNFEFDVLVDSLDSKIVKSISLDKFKDWKPALGATDVLTLTRIRSLVVGEDKEDRQVLIKLKQIYEKLGSNIQNISVTWSSEIIPTLYQILGVEGGGDFCPNIKHLSISFNGIVESFGFTPPENPTSKTIPPKKKLKVISISSIFQAKSGTAFISTFFQDLVSAAPKLEKLDMKSCSCPSLKINKELKWFRFHSVNPNILHLNEEEETSSNIENKDRNFNLVDISYLLEEVKDSLQYLELVSSGSHAPCDKCYHPSMQLKIPAMPKLRALINRNNEVFRIHLNLWQLGRENMPSLIRLIFSNHGFEDGRRDIWYEISQGLLQQDCGSMDEIRVGVKRLGLLGIDSASTSALAGLRRTTFPYLERLDLLLQQEEGDDDMDPSTRVGLALESCSTLGLVHLRIETEFSYPMSGMVKALWECECREELFSGLKTLEIINIHQPRRKMVTDDLNSDEEKEFAEALIMTKGMRSVVFGGYLLRGGHAGRVLKLISDNQLPVEFVDVD